MKPTAYCKSTVEHHEVLMEIQLPVEIAVCVTVEREAPVGDISEARTFTKVASVFPIGNVTYEHDLRKWLTDEHVAIAVKTALANAPHKPNSATADFVEDTP
jgi:hypothetical protein